MTGRDLFYLGNVIMVATVFGNTFPDTLPKAILASFEMILILGVIALFYNWGKKDASW